MTPAERRAWYEASLVPLEHRRKHGIVLMHLELLPEEIAAGAAAVASGGRFEQGVLEQMKRADKAVPAPATPTPPLAARKPAPAPRPAAKPAPPAAARSALAATTTPSKTPKTQPKAPPMTPKKPAPKPAPKPTPKPRTTTSAPVPRDVLLAVASDIATQAAEARRAQREQAEIDAKIHRVVGSTEAPAARIDACGNVSLSIVPRGAR